VDVDEYQWQCSDFRVDWNRFCDKDQQCRDCVQSSGRCGTSGNALCGDVNGCITCDDLPERCDPAGPFKGIFMLYRDLIRLRRNWYNNTRGLRGQHVSVFHVNNNDKLIAYHRWENDGPGDDVVVVLNFANRTYASYRIGLPRGGYWHVRFNSGYQGYDGSFSRVVSRCAIRP
jgi:1,4-alpha-glucan branching enzyme